MALTIFCLGRSGEALRSQLSPLTLNLITMCRVNHYVIEYSVLPLNTVFSVLITSYAASVSLSIRWMATCCLLFGENLILTRAVQPVATCRQSPYLRKPAIVIVTSFSLWRLAPTALAALTALIPIMTSLSLWRLAPTALAVPVLIMTAFLLWRHSLLSWSLPPLRTYLRYRHLTAFNI